MPEQTSPTGADFISRASQDASAAVRSCEALRAVGVKIWFDKNELRGGDSWSAQIKKHIYDCAIFMPVISAHTNARTEGCFRGEWNLATRRLMNIVHNALPKLQRSREECCGLWVFDLPAVLSRTQQRVWLTA